MNLEWTTEQYPGWDGTGTIAQSWYAAHDKYTCRIDQFTAAEGGGYAYTVEYCGNALLHGDSESAESWDAAEQAVLTLLANH